MSVGDLGMNDLPKPTNSDIHKCRKEVRYMKKLLVKLVPAFAALAVVAAKIFAVMPCHGPCYEPEMPEELKR